MPKYARLEKVQGWWFLQRLINKYKYVILELKMEEGKNNCFTLIFKEVT